MSGAERPIEEQAASVGTEAAWPGPLMAGDLQQLSDQLPLGMLVMDSGQGRLLHVNAEAERLLGLRRSQLLGQAAGEVLPSALAALCLPPRWRALENSSRHAAREALWLPNAKGPRWVQLQRSLIPWRGLRRPAGMLTLSDHSAQRQLERALQESDTRFREVTEAVSECLFVTTPDWDRLHFSSPLLLDLLGLSTLDLAQGPRQFERRIHPEDLGLYARRLSAQARGEASDLILRILHPAKGLRWMRLRCRPQRHPGGQTLVYGILADISEEQQQHRELAQARDQAEAASRAKSEFMANMSHEIRTPLNGMLGMTELLLGTALSRQQRGYAEAALRSAQDLLGLIDEVLDFASAQAGQLRLHPGPYTPAMLARQCLDAVRPATEARGLALRLDLPDRLPEQACGDARRIRQTLMELLLNALKFTVSGEIGLRLEPQGSTLHWHVSDTGVGMAPELLQRLFQPFTQGNASLSRQHEGAGMGLALAAQLAELMQGRLQARSEPGRGSLFTLSLPLGDSGGRQSHTQASAPEACILVVEDNPVNQQISTEMLERLGYRWRVCEDALSGLRALCEQRFDLVMMDIHMPGMDGTQALRLFRGGPQPDYAFISERHTPVIAVTANALGGDGSRWREHGFDDYLPKPFRIDQLQDMLQRCIAVDNTRKLDVERANPAENPPPTDGTSMSAQSASAANPVPRLDPEAIARLRELDPGGANHLLERVVAAYLKSLDRLLPDLAQARAAGAQGLDLAAVRHVAHTLKSSSASLGAMQLSQRCADIEAMARQGQTEGLDILLDGMHDEVALVREALNELLATP